MTEEDTEAIQTRVPRSVTVENTGASQTRVPRPVADEGNTVATHTLVRDTVAVLALELNAGNGRRCDGASRVEPCGFALPVAWHGRF